MGGAHAFIDESKRDGYTIVVVMVAAHTLTDARAQLRRSLLPGQRALHFKNERDSRRRQLLGTMRALNLSARVYTRRHDAEVTARQACLEAVVEDVAAEDISRLVLELSDSDLARDMRTLTAARRKHSASFEFLHLRAPQEPMLWVADAIAWAWPQGGAWKASIASLVTQHRDV